MNDVVHQNIQNWLKEDGLGEVEVYWKSLPTHPVKAVLKIKSKLLLAGLPWFCTVFETLDASLKNSFAPLKKLEGRYFDGPQDFELDFLMPWNVAITGERLALNLLHRASAVATATKVLVDIAKPFGIKVLDTRKTTPGIRSLEKYAVTVGGGCNHRFTQVDSFMIKDNHKELMGLRGAIEFFKNLNQPYKTIITEIHSLNELDVAREFGMNYFMLDNFSKEMLLEACKTKKSGEFFEVSGGINQTTIKDVMIKGVDAVSVGKITQFPEPVDISFKFSVENL